MVFLVKKFPFFSPSILCKAGGESSDCKIVHPLSRDSLQQRRHLIYPGLAEHNHRFNYNFHIHFSRPLFYRLYLRFVHCLTAPKTLSFRKTAYHSGYPRGQPTLYTRSRKGLYEMETINTTISKNIF